MPLRSLTGFTSKVSPGFNNSVAMESLAKNLLRRVTKKKDWSMTDVNKGENGKDRSEDSQRPIVSSS